MDEERVVDGRIKTIVLPTPERVAKGDLIVEETGKGGINIRTRRTFNEPLQWYARNGHVTDAQKAAGLRFYTLWYYGAMRSRHVLSKFGDQRLPASGDADCPAQAQEAYHHARKAIRGVREQEVAHLVCCHCEKAGKHGQMQLLRSALDDLVKHFGIK